MRASDVQYRSFVLTWQQVKEEGNCLKKSHIIVMKTTKLMEVLDALKKVGVDATITPTITLKSGRVDFGLKGSLSYGQGTEDHIQWDFSVTGDVQEGIKEALKAYWGTIPFHHLNAEGRKAHYSEIIKTVAEYEFEFSITEMKSTLKGGRLVGKAAMTFSLKGPKLNCEGNFTADVDISLEKYFGLASDLEELASN